MTYYKLGYWGFDEGFYVFLTHDEEFHQSQFNEMVLECAKPAYDKMAATGREYITFSDIIGSVIDCMVEKHGFKVLDTEIEFMPENDIIGTDEEPVPQDKDYQRLVKYLRTHE